MRRWPTPTSSLPAPSCCGLHNLASILRRHRQHDRGRPSSSAPGSLIPVAASPCLILAWAAPLGCGSPAAGQPSLLTPDRLIRTRGLSLFRPHCRSPEVARVRLRWRPFRRNPCGVGAVRTLSPLQNILPSLATTGFDRHLGRRRSPAMAWGRGSKTWPPRCLGSAPRWWHCRNSIIRRRSRAALCVSPGPAPLSVLSSAKRLAFGPLFPGAWLSPVRR